MKPAKWIATSVLLALLGEAGAQTPHIKAALDAYQKGLVEQQQKHFSSAIKLFHEAIKIEPTFIEVRQALIQADLEDGKRLEAAAAITQLLQIEPENISDRLALAQFLQEQHQQTRALAQFSAVLKIDAYNPDALWGLALVARELGMADRAAEALDRGRKRFPHDARFQVADTATPQKP